VILLSLAAGAAVTLYRNDLVHAAMRSIGQEGTYVKLESALGGPSFGTPRAVQQMAAAAAALTATSASDAPSAVATPTSTTTPASTSSPAAPSTASPAADSAPTAPSTDAKVQASAAPSEPAKPAEAPRHPETTKAVSSPRPTPHASGPETAVDPVFKTPKKGKKGGKGSEYDPLNPSL
jgi:hypothetical protein